MSSNRHTALARDALAITRATLTDDVDGAAAVVSALPAQDVPATMGALVAMIRVALLTDPRVELEAFLEACRVSIDRADAAGAP